jgi:hypothetical protein
MRGTDPARLSRHAERLRQEGRCLAAAAGYSMALAAVREKTHTHI